MIRSLPVVVNTFWSYVEQVTSLPPGWRKHAHDGVSLAIARSPLELWTLAATHVFNHRRALCDAIWADIVALDGGRIVTEHRFMREYVWCVHVSGFGARVVSKKIQAILQAHSIEDATGAFIVSTLDNIIRLEELEQRVYPVWRNKAKATAIQAIRELILDLGWESFSRLYLVHGPNPTKLMALPYIGPALARHLARNLGNVNVAKPDRHLLRLAAKFNLASVEELCRQAYPGKLVGYVDLVLWLAAVDCGTLPEKAEFRPNQNDTTTEPGTFAPQPGWAS